MKFRRLDGDHGLYVRGSGDNLIMLAVNVDDVVIAYAGSEAAMKAGFMEELKRVYEIKDVGPISFCLGVRVQRDETTGSITMSMPAYI